MKIKNIKEALSLFEENAVAQQEATETGNYKIGNKCHDKIVKAVDFLKEHDAINELMPFWEHKSENVRIWASSYFLNDYEEAENILNEIAKNEGINSLIAKTTVSEWKKGNLKL